MEQRRTLRIERPCLLLVEGEDDRAALEPLIQFIGLYGAIQIVPVGGKHEFARVIKALRELPDFDAVVQALGVVCDADDNPRGAFQRIQNAFKRAGLPVPRRAATITAELPHTGVLVVPAANQQGSLEDVFWSSLEQDPRTGCIAKLIECVGESGFPVRQVNKAQLYAYLAVHHERSGLRIGEAVQAGFFDFDHPAFEPFRQFLQALASQVQSA